MKAIQNVCDYVGVESSVTALRERWLSINTERLRTAALLIGTPSVWFDELFSHFRNNCLIHVEGDEFSKFSDSAEALFVELIEQAAVEIANTELTDFELHELQNALRDGDGTIH